MATPVAAVPVHMYNTLLEIGGALHKYVVKI